MTRYPPFAVALLLLNAGDFALGYEVRIPLPELVGNQSVTSLEWSAIYSSGGGASIPSSAAIEFPLRFEWSGTIKAGSVIGDGISRVPIEKELRGTFSSGISLRGSNFIFLPGYELPATGVFQASWQLNGLSSAPFFHDCLLGDCAIAPSGVSLTLVPDFSSLESSIPFLKPLGEMESRDANQGLILLKPIEVNITSAALVYEEVPEPSAASLIVIAMIISANTFHFARRHHRT